VLNMQNLSLERMKNLAAQANLKKFASLLNSLAVILGCFAV
jgi:hypothetical protein